MNVKAQLSMMSILMWIILVVIGAVMTPLLAEQAETVYNATNDTTTRILSQTLVPFFWLGVIITFFMFVTPVRPREYG